MADEIKLEDHFKQLDEIINHLDNADISLEESFNLYKSGVELLKKCNDSIDKVEKELIILNNNES